MSFLTKDFYITKGSTYQEEFIIRADFGLLNFVLFELRGAYAQSAYSKTKYPINVVSEKPGVILVTFNPSDTQSKRHDRYVYNIECEDADGFVISLLSGNVYLSESVV
jgi:hypothetical protein